MLASGPAKPSGVVEALYQHRDAIWDTTTARATRNDADHLVLKLIASGILSFGKRSRSEQQRHKSSRRWIFEATVQLATKQLPNGIATFVYKDATRWALI